MSLTAKRAVFLPPFGELADPALLAELAVAAEEAGWDGVFLWDHVQYRAPVEAVLDPWIAMAAIAAATRRVRIGPMVTPLARRRPWVLARQVAALDLLSGGRFVLGAGLGLDSSGAELSSFGEELDAPTRAAMLDEALAVVTGLLTGEPFEHRGASYEVRPTRFLPAAVQQPLPVWLAARWPNRAPLRRAARFQGAFVIDLEGPGELAACKQLLDSMRRGEGPGASTATAPFDLVVRARPGEDVAALAAAGATWVLCDFDPFDLGRNEVRRIVEEGPRS